MPEPGFLTTVNEIRKGDLITELDDALAELVGSVLASAKPGALVLTLRVKPASRGVLVVSDDVKLKPPVVERDPTIFYPTAENGLSRQDPTQHPLPGVRRVEEPPQPVPLRKVE